MHNLIVVPLKSCVPVAKLLSTRWLVVHSWVRDLVVPFLWMTLTTVTLKRRLILSKRLFGMMCCRVDRTKLFSHTSWPVCHLHPKTLFEIAMVLSTNRGSFPSNSHVSATFSILLRFGESGIRQIVRDSMLTGRWWEGRILINLCGNNNVRNYDLLQSDFFPRCRTVLGVAKGFFWYVVKLGKRWGPETLWFFTLEKHGIKIHFPKIISRACRSDTSGQEKVAAHPNGALYFHERQEHAIFSTPHNLWPADRMRSPSL